MKSELARYDALAHLVNETTFIHDEERRIVFVSPSVEHLLGYTEEEFTQLRTPELIHPDDIPIATREAIAVRKKAGASYRVALRLRRRDGSWIWVEICGRNLLHDPDIGGVVSTFRDISRQRTLEEQLAYQASHDHLTGLLNRGRLETELTRALDRATGDCMLAVLFFDFDGFKLINDNLGHEAGDLLLFEAAKRLRSSVGPLCKAARFGGDEFVVVCPDVEGPDEALAIAERVRTSVGGNFELRNTDAFASISIGVAVGGRTVPAQDLLRWADMALYEAKRRGRNRSQLFDADLESSLVDRLENERALGEALEQGQLRVWYQPVVDLETGCTSAAEALLRWQHPSRGWLYASDFVELAEELGLLVEMGAFALRQACLDAARFPIDPVSGRSPDVRVNLSPRQLSDRQLVERVEQALLDSGLPPERLNLGITEKTLRDNYDLVAPALRALDALGAGLTIADFGTSYSSLTDLEDLPVRTVSLARQLIRNMDTNPIAGAIIGAVISVMKEAGFETLAVGVELEDQARMLRDLGCRFGQGEWFETALPMAVFCQRMSTPPKRVRSFLRASSLNYV